MRKYLAIGEKVGDLREYLIRELNSGRSVPEIAKELGISRATIYYWMLKLGIKIKKEYS